MITWADIKAELEKEKGLTFDEALDRAARRLRREASEAAYAELWGSDEGVSDPNYLPS